MLNRVRVYRNLNNGLLSIQEVGSGLILAHCAALRLRDALFKVNEQGRQRVVQTRRKSVHAHVEGLIEEVEGLVSYKGRSLPAFAFPPGAPCDLGNQRRSLRYTPYKWPTFVDEHLQVVTQAKVVCIQASGRMSATLS